MVRGTLRLYVGYAAGVGATYAMLSEGRRRRARGTDVVVAFVETWSRSHTADQLGELEVVPRRAIGDVEQVDVGAVLRRRPAVALVDDIARANAPGSGNAGRWQDVEELLAAGIDVVGTVNIQHVESLCDVVERITGTVTPERVPDSFLRTAEQIELVDMTPQALRRRVAHGNVHPPEQVDAELSNSFREGTLGALRELALLWLADRVDEDLQRTMKAHDISGPWETRERILVAVSGGPQDGSLIRRAARLAARGAADVLAVHVVAGTEGAGVPAVEHGRALVERLGGAFREVVGPDVARALLDVARAEQVTQLVVGSGPRRRSGVPATVVHRVIGGAGPIDVHVVSREAEAAGPRMKARRPGGLDSRRRLVALAVVVVGLPALTVVLEHGRATLGLPGVLLIYLAFVVGVSAVGGLWPAIAAAVASSLLLNWYFTPTLHTWKIAHAENVLALIVFVLVAVVVSVLVDREARSRAEAQRGRAEAEALARLAGWLVDEEDPLPQLVEHLRTTFGLRSVAVLRRREDSWDVEAAAGEDEISEPADGSESIELGSDSALVLLGSRLPADANRVLVAFAAQLAAAVRARELAREAAGAAELAEVNELRTAILAAVSHDLRTPLASIKASVSSLRQRDVRWTDEETADFLATIEEESDRLNDLVGNLLDMSRIQTGALLLVPRSVGLDEVVPRALASLAGGGRGIEVDVPESLPRVTVDAALLERAVANVAANARTWNMPGLPVRILGSTAAGRVELRVVDRGPGIRPDERDRVFQPFQRLGDRPSGDGVGLGLAVARGFVEAMGGELSIEDTPGGGLTMVLSFEAAA